MSKLNNFKNKLEIIKMAKTHSIEEVAKEFNISIKKVRRLVFIYEEFGAVEFFNQLGKRGYEDSRRNALTPELEKKIILANLEHGWGGVTIQKELKLKLSFMSIHRVLREAGLVNLETKNTNADYYDTSYNNKYGDLTRLFKHFSSPFKSNLIFTTKINFKLDNVYIDPIDYEVGSILPEFLTTIIDINSGFISFSFASERSKLYSHIHKDYFLEVAKKNNFSYNNNDINFFIGKRDKVVNDIHKQYKFPDIFNNNNGKKFKQKKMDSNTDNPNHPFHDTSKLLFKNMIDNSLHAIKKNFVKKVLETKEIKSLNELLIITYSYQLYHNNFFKDKNYGNLTPKEIIKRWNNKINFDFFEIPPIISPKYITDLVSKKDRTNPITSLILSEEDKNNIKQTIFDSFDKDVKFSRETYNPEKDKDLLDKLNVKLLLNRKSKKLVKNILHEKGKLLRYIGHWDEAEEIYEELLNKFAKHEDKTITADILIEYGFFNFQKSNDTKALKLYKKASKISKISNYNDGILRSNYQIASLYIHNQENKKANKYINESIKIANKINDKLSLIRIETLLGQLYINEKRYKEAEEKYSNLLKMIDSDDPLYSKYLGVVLSNLSLIFMELKFYSKSLYYAKKVLALKEKNNEVGQVVLALGGIGNINFYKKNFKNAILYFNKQLKLAEDLDYRDAMIQALTGLGSVYSVLKKSKVAIRKYELALEVALESKTGMYIYTTYYNLGLEYLDQKQFSEAEKYFIKLKELSSQGKNTVKYNQAKKYLKACKNKESISPE